MTPLIKTCFKCGRTLPVSEFYRHPEMSDGHLNKCKECTKDDVRKNRKKKIVYYRMYDRKRAMTPKRIEEREKYKRTEKSKETKTKTLKKYRKNNPKKILAQRTLRRAVLNGEIIPMPCEVCGKTEKIHAHHEDYNKPLDVIWLCPKHHRWIHS